MNAVNNSSTEILYNILKEFTTTYAGKISDIFNTMHYGCSRVPRTITQSLSRRIQILQRSFSGSPFGTFGFRPVASASQTR